MSYAEFLHRKRPSDRATGIEVAGSDLSPKLFDFQRAITRWALHRGRAAVWADCGLGKSWIALEWGRVIHAATGSPVLILTPLAVAQQFYDEGQKLGIEVAVCRSADDVTAGINVTNYDRLHLFDAARFDAVVLDESSCLKDYTSATRNALIDAFAETPFRLACTATPAPNDHIELGNHAEFLGVVTRAEMLAMFFVHDGGSTQDWRLKGHAQLDFWHWLCAWAVALRSPEDLGFDGSAYNLPPLHVVEHVVKSIGGRAEGMLFALEARTLHEQRAARRGSLSSRVELCAQLAEEAGEEPFLAWCDLNAESEALTKAIPGAVEIRGSDDPGFKESAMTAFRRGETRVLVTKPSIAGWGVNWQHCRNVAFVGLSNSFEAWYQAIRRTWRFGQTKPVNCHVITSDLEGRVVANLRRKQVDAERMMSAMVAEMADLSRAELGSTRRDSASYVPAQTMEIPAWISSET